GVRLEHVRGRLRMDAPAFRATLGYAFDEGRLEPRGDREVRVTGHVPSPSAEQRAELDQFLLGLGQTRYAASDGLSDPELATYMVEGGSVEEAGGTLILSDAFQDMTVAVV